MASEDQRARRDEHGCDLVLEVGGEGYGLAVWGERQVDGTWKFHRDSTSMMLDVGTNTVAIAGKRPVGLLPCERETGPELEATEW